MADDKKPAELKFMFQQNLDIPRGKVGVKPMGAHQFLVMARDNLTDAQIVMAITRFIAKHDPESGVNRPEENLP
jgi:hypothetical protein